MISRNFCFELDQYGHAIFCVCDTDGDTSTRGIKSDSSGASFGFCEILPSSREPDVEWPAPYDALASRMVPLKTLGNRWKSKDRIAGMQAQITPTSTSIVLQ